MGNSYQQEERELLLIDYIWRVLRRWRSIIVSMIVCAVVVGGVKYFKDSRDLQEQKNATLSPEEQLEEMINQLTDEEQSAVNQVLRFEDMKAEKEEYIDSAAIMKLNSAEVNRNVLQYHVEFGKNSAELLRAYKSSFLTEEVMKEIANVSDDMEVSDVQDMISVSYDAQTGLQLDGGSKVIFDDTTTNESLYITVRGLSKEEVMDISGVVKKAIADYAKKAQDIYGSHKISLTNEFYQNGKDDDVGNMQNDIYNQVYEFQNKINALSSGFSEEQNAVLEAYNSMENQSDDSETEEIDVKASVSKKWILLGAFLGLCIIAGWEFFVWVLGDKVTSPEELIENFPIYNFGIYQDEEKSKKKKLFSGIDSLFYRICYSGRMKLTCEQSFDMILSGIVEKAKANNIEHIYVTSTGTGDEQKDVVDRLIRVAEAQGVSLEMGDNPCVYGNELSRMTQLGCVIICESVADVKRKNFVRLLQMCGEYDVRVMGTVFIL